MLLDPIWPSRQKIEKLARRGRSQDRLAALHQERLLDEALKETFPASDPVSVMRVT